MTRRISLTSIESREDESPCEGCGTSRRAFLGQISLTALAAVVASELGASSAQAFPITFATGTQLPGNQRSYPIPASDGATIDHAEEVIVARLHQQVYAFNLACPHENTALRWRPEDMRFQCPRHGSKYQPDGTFISGRATRNMDRFAVQRVGDAILVDLNRLYRSDQQAALWTAAVVAL